jgi:predicted HTH transcriptional regulator
LEELVSGHAVETVRLEFKREVPVRDEAIKKISSFANTYGGFIVVGAQADSKDGRIQSLPGSIRSRVSSKRSCSGVLTPSAL